MKSASVGSHSREEQYGATSSELWSNLLHYPSNKRTISWPALIVSFINEFLATIGFTFVSVYATFLTAPSTSLVNGLALGIVQGAAYLMFSNWQAPKKYIDGELPRHLSWSISLSHTCAARNGLKYLPFYMAVQTLGSLIAGALLVPFGASAPAFVAFTTDPEFTTAVACEILASFVICFGSLFSNYYSVDEEQEPHRSKPSHVHASIARGLTTAIFLSKSYYSGDFVVWFAGCFGTCISTACPTDTPMSGAPAFYMLFPLVGAVAAGLIFLVEVLIHGAGGKVAKTKSVNKQINNESLKDALLPEGTRSTRKEK